MLGIGNADTAENGDRSAIHVITPVACQISRQDPGIPTLSGQGWVQVIPATKLASIMGEGEHYEGFFCNYEVSPVYAARFAASGLRPNALGADGELRGVEADEHPFFVATLFQPQLTSVRGRAPHPLIIGFLQAAASAQEPD